MSRRPEPCGPTDDQLGDIACYFARLCLEAERGLRPLAQLEQFMDPAAALRIRGLVTVGQFEGGPIEASDVGPAHLTRHTDGTVFATVVTRTEGHRWGALTLKLREHDGQVQIADIRRLLARTQPDPRSQQRTQSSSIPVPRQRSL